MSTTAGGARPLLAALLTVIAASGADAGPAPGQAAADYALAACLTQEATGPLRDEGYSLGSIAIARSGLSPLDFGAVRAAVARESKRRPMTTVHVDAPVAESDRPAPLAHCLEVARSPAVRAALARVGR